MVNNPDTLIAKFLSGETTLHEEKELQNWLNLSEENKKYFQQMKIIWHAHEKINISEDAALRKITSQLRLFTGFKKIWYNWQKIAAILIIPVFIFGGSQFLLRKEKAQKIQGSALHEVATPFGAITTMILPDSSKVWLNSGSKIKYPQKFEPDKRIVFLEGEAYFEVKSNELRPFIVSTREFIVKATGTKFNVRAYSDDETPQVALVKGKVAITENRKDHPWEVNLKPNEVLNYKHENSNISTISEDIYKCYAWKDGKLVFRNDPFEEVARRMSIQYNVTIELQGEKLKQYSFRATFKNESLVEVLNLLKISSPFVYRQQPPKLLPDGSYSKKKIIISSI